VRAGSLRHRVTLQQLVAGSPQRRPDGEPDAAWVEYLTVYAAVEPVTGREFFAAQAVEHEADTTIRMRYRTGITTAMRVVFEGRTYDIRAVLDHHERHIELRLLCKQGANSG